MYIWYAIKYEAVMHFDVSAGNMERLDKHFCLTKNLTSWKNITREWNAILVRQKGCAIDVSAQPTILDIEIIVRHAWEFQQ